MTVRKGILRLGKYRKEPTSGQNVPKLWGECLVAASYVSFAYAKRRKLTHSATAPLPTKSDEYHRIQLLHAVQEVPK